MFYATKFSNSNDITGSTFNVYQPYSYIPWYPLPTQTAPYAVNHNALEFILINNTGTLQGRSYTATVVFTYKFDGIYTRLLSNPSDFTGSIIPVGGQVLSSTNSISIVPTDQKNGATVTISSTVNLNGTTPVDKFTILLSGGKDNYIAICDPRIYSEYYGKNLTCGSSAGNITAQVSLVDFKVTVSQDVNTGLLNNINQNQQITNDKLDNIDSTLKDDDVSGAEDSASGFFNDFETDDFGLSSIITMPLEFINGLTSSTCYSLNLPLPFVDTNVTLPCMTSIYENYFGSFFTLYQTITTGFIAYGVCVNIFRLVQGFKSPDNDVVEVMEL